MRNVILLIVISVIIVSCNKDDNSENAKVIIKGTISNSNQKSTQSKSDNTLSLADAKKVLVFYGTRYSLVDIQNGSFSVSAEMGYATALVFLDAENMYIGNLFTSGLNMLPLGDLKDGENTVIDLQSLTLDSTNVVPSHNPIGDEIIITDEEVTRLKELGGYFESLAKNIDADNDGVPDILSKKQLSISSQFMFYGGAWGTDNTSPSQIDTSQLYINYGVRIEGNISMAPANSNYVALSGPDGNPYSTIVLSHYVADKDCFISLFRRPNQNQQSIPSSDFLPFTKGNYSFTLTGNQFYTLNYSNINAKYYLVIATPTLHTNSDGKITSVSIEYKLPDNTIVDPANFLTNLQLQFEVNVGNRVHIGSLYENVKTNLTINDLTYIAVDETVYISALRQLSVNYNDLLGNEYDVIWHKSTN
jgi:hypothetical protein